MGSYLSVYNNTRDTYNVKVGIDEAAVRVFNIVMAVLTAVTLTIAGAGIAAPVFSVAVAASGAMKVLGLTTASLVAFTKIAAAISGLTIAADVAGWATAMAIFISQELEDESYVPIAPNAQHKFGRYTLSLWRQAECIRVRPNPSNRAQVLMDTVYMRPIFTGATNNSTLVHDIQFWINRWNHENVTVIEADGIDNFSRMSIDEASAQLEGIDWMKVIEETRAKAKKEVLEKEGIHLQEKYA